MKSSGDGNLNKRNIVSIGLFLLFVGTALFLSRTVHYLLFHSIAELISITVGFSLFILTWASLKYLRNNYLALLGSAYGTICAVDILHTLTFKGMNVIPDVTTNYPTQFWLTARFIEALALLLAPLTIHRRIHFGIATFAFGVLGTVGILMIWLGHAPATFVDGDGLTAFKIYSEYAIIGMLGVSLFLLWRVRYEFPHEVFYLLVGSVVLAIATEICFAHYVLFYDFVNELGHYFRFVSVVLAFLAIVATGIQRPADLLFREVCLKEQKLESLAQSLRATLDASPVPMAVNDAAKNITYVNKAFTRVFGYVLEEIPTLDAWWPRAYPDQSYREWVAKEWLARVDEAATGSPFEAMEARICCKDGNLKTVLADWAPLVHAGGKESVVTLYDITERKLDEERRKLWTQVFEHADIGLSIGDPVANVIRDVNPAFVKRRGYTKDELVGQPVSILFPYDRLANVMGLVRKADETGHANFETEHLAKDGTRFPVMLDITVVKDGQGNPVSRYVFAIDITERKLAEKALHESRERLEAAASAGIVGVWDWDIPNNRLIWDKVMYQLYGIREEDFGGAYEAWVAALHPDDKDYTEREVQAAMCGERDYAPEFRVIWPNGSIHHIKAASRITFDEQGKPLRMVGVNYDQTDQKSIEAMLQDGIDRRTQELQKARLAAEVANIAKSAFLANMSHEMRTPLHQIRGLSQLVRRDSLLPRQTEHMEKLDIACRNMTAIIDTILTLTRIEAGQFERDETPFSLSEILHDVVTTAQDKAAAKGLRFELESIDVPDQLIGDNKLIQQALLNYVTNAIRFTEIGGVTVRVSLASELGQNLLVRFEVEDTGMGIAPDDLPRLFNIFEQADMSSTRKHGGVGLGLAMTKKLAEIMNGDAGCDSRLGEGSTFWFTAHMRKP